MGDQKAAEFVQDSIVNVMTGLGTTKDRATHNSWESSVYDAETLRTMYAESWLARRCVDIPADEAVSKDREITSPSISPEQIDEFHRTERRLKVKKRLSTGIKWARLFGGGAVYVAVEGQNIEEPLEISRIRKGARVNLIVFSRNELTPSSNKIDDDEFSPGFGRPLEYVVNVTGKKIHASRLIIFDGIEVPDNQTADYWGSSIFDSALQKDIEHCETALESLTAALEQSVVDVISIPELFQKLIDPNSRDQLRSRISEGALVKSVYKTLMLDKEEMFQRNEASGSLTAGGEIVKTILQIPSGATGIPVTKLLGISPGGLNATGESDSENYYGMLEDIRSDIDEALEIIDQVLCMSLFGRVFDDWEYSWDPFWSTDKVEESNITTARINSLVTLVSADIIPASVATRQLYDDGVFSALDEATVKEIEDMEDFGDEDTSNEEPNTGEEPNPNEQPDNEDNENLDDLENDAAQT